MLFKRMRLGPTLLAVCLALVACAHGGAPACASGQHAGHVAELFFGRSIKGGGSVSDAEFAAFVDEEVAPRFPAGFTLVDAKGAWRSVASKAVRERSKVLIIVLAGAPGEAAKLDAIRDAYRKRFRQDSVLLVEQPSCVSF